MSFNVGYPSSVVSGYSKSVKSHDQSTMSMDEAYRRLGHKLSQRVTSGKHYSAHVVVNLGSHPRSAFQAEVHQATSVSHTNELWDRSQKVPKMGYSDHGSHQRISDYSILKKLTCHAKTTFRTIESTKHLSPEKGSTKKRTSPTALSPHLLSSIDQSERLSSSKGLLESVLEVQPPPRRCLTHPREAISNNGFDNTDGNLIVFEGDVISPSNVHHLKEGELGTLRVLDLLGQGTFAQVFLCECVETGDRIALKVVKNKQAYTRQAAVEIDVFRALTGSKVNMVHLECYFVHQNHLCLVFELLGMNLYEVLKKRQFRGLPLSVVRSLLQQAVEGVKDLSAKSIVHCDLKPENVLLYVDDDSIVHASGNSFGGISSIGRSKTPNLGTKILSENSTPATQDNVTVTTRSSSGSDESQGPKIKLIDFGSACFEGHSAHTYIQSRFYRSPEVLIGLPYDSAIDMWSLGCVAAELFLGLPILPGVHEHDQLGRICEMIAPLPDWMLDQGSKSTKYFVKQFVRSSEHGKVIPAQVRTPSPIGESEEGSSTPSPPPPPPRPSWRIKTQQEYINSLSPSEIQKKGGLAKLEKQPTNRYFKRKKLADIIMLHGHVSSLEDKEELASFVHFLLGILDPDPWKRWTAFQASQHPFLTGIRPHRRPEGPDSDTFGVYWLPPWDPSICRRKLLNVQKIREKQQSLRRNFGRSTYDTDRVIVDTPDKFRRLSEATSLTAIDASGSTITSRTALIGDPAYESRYSYSQVGSSSDHTSPPTSLGVSGSTFPGLSVTGSLGSMSGAFAPPQSLADIGHRIGGIPSSLMITSSSAQSFGDISVPQPAMPAMPGLQSFSAMSFDSACIPVESEFGYALQRPGVVPSQDLASSFSSQYSTPGGGIELSPHGSVQYHHPQGMASRSVSGLVQVGQGAGRNATVPMMTGRRSRRGFNVPLSPRSHSFSIHNPPTSIREDAADYQLGSGTGDAGVTSSSVGSGASLLAQQLEEQAAIARDNMRGMEALQKQQRHLGYGNPPMLPRQNAYYTTYITSDGTPVVASSNLEASAMAPASMSHLSAGYGRGYTEGTALEMQYLASPGTLHPQIYSYNDGSAQQRQQHRQQQSPYSNHYYGGLSM